MRTIREWLWLRLTPSGRYERRCAKRYDAILKRQEAYIREHRDEIRARAPRRTIVLTDQPTAYWRLEEDR